MTTTTQTVQTVEAFVTKGVALLTAEIEAAMGKDGVRPLFPAYEVPKWYLEVARQISEEFASAKKEPDFARLKKKVAELRYTLRDNLFRYCLAGRDGLASRFGALAPEFQMTILTQKNAFEAFLPLIEEKKANLAEASRLAWAYRDALVDAEQAQQRKLQKVRAAARAKETRARGIQRRNMADHLRTLVGTRLAS